MVTRAVIVGAACVILPLCMFTNGILAPLLFDALNPTSSPWLPVSENVSSLVTLSPGQHTWQQVDPVFWVATSNGFDTIIMGVVLAVVKVRTPDAVTERETRYPKRYFALVGMLRAMGMVLVQYAMPGERTAPYLQVMLGRVSIPLTFLLRFLILKKRPTLRKAICALVIFLAVTLSMLPVFVSKLEDEAQRKEEGGASGIWRVVWPIIWVLAAIPGILSGLVMERTVKDDTARRTGATAEDDTTRLMDAAEGDLQQEECEQQISTISRDEKEADQLNMIYTLFWTFLMTFISVFFLLWTDFIPEFGLVKAPQLFGKQMYFNCKCMFSIPEQCTSGVALLYWGRFIARFLAFTCRALLLRYAEGSNFIAIFTLLFWTLFDEQPLRWHPHTSISTWLSIAALALMVPALIIYSTGKAEVTKGNITSVTTATQQLPADRSQAYT